MAFPSAARTDIHGDDMFKIVAAAIRADIYVFISGFSEALTSGFLYYLRQREYISAALTLIHVIHLCGGL